MICVIRPRFSGLGAGVKFLSDADKKNLATPPAGEPGETLCVLVPHSTPFAPCPLPLVLVLAALFRERA